MAPFCYWTILGWILQQRRLRRLRRMWQLCRVNCSCCCIAFVAELWFWTNCQKWRAKRGKG